MTGAAGQRPIRRARQLAVLAYAFRPMFLAAGSWAIVALALWLAMVFGYLRLPTLFDPLSWHIHEMLFGFAMAAVAGFLLTAIPNWTGRLPVRGLPLAGLALLWLLGRLACLVSAVLPSWLAVMADLAFPATLLGVAAREIVAGRNWRNLPMTAPLAIFVIADLLMHLEALGWPIPAAFDWPIPAGLGWRLGLAAPVILIAAVGGRIIPSFTRNWLLRRKTSHLPAPHLPAPHGPLDTAALVALAIAFVAWALLPGHRIAGALLIGAALLNAIRLSRWAGLASWPEKLLFILHVGYGWVAAGTLLLGLSIFDLGVPVSAAVHALTAGAIAVMVLAVMPRVTLGHTGRDLVAGRATILVFVLANAAALARVCASWHAELATLLLPVAGSLWIAAFALFELVYGPMLLTRKPARSGPSP